MGKAKSSNSATVPQRNVGGRPRKFADESRPITVTLPIQTLERLGAIDRDRARAIVKATDSVSGGSVTHQPIEIVQVLPGLGIILVGPSRYLGKIDFLKLVEVAPRRFLLVIPSGTMTDSLEIALGDVMERIPERETQERKLMSDLLLLLRRFRRSNKVSKAEILFVDTAR
jgi:hypothetical protein